MFDFDQPPMIAGLLLGLAAPPEIKVPEPPASGISAVNPGMSKISTGLNPGRVEIRRGDNRKKIHQIRAGAVMLACQVYTCIFLLCFVPNPSCEGQLRRLDTTRSGEIAIISHIARILNNRC